MEKLYRDFIVIASLFIAVTFVLNIAPILRCVVDEGRVKVKYLPCEKSMQNRLQKKSLPDDSKLHRDSPEEMLNMDIKSPSASKTGSGDLPNHHLQGTVWDTDSGRDRIVQQLNLRKFKERDKDFVISISGSGDFNEAMGNGVFVQGGCNYKNCRLVRGDSKEKIIDARIFNTYISYNEIPHHTRHPGQIWILYILEGPLASPDYFLLDNVMNWTATYRWDSTLVAPYEKWVPFNNGTKAAKRNYAKGKSKKCAIFVSNCETTNNRMGYVKELKKYIDVDVYGSCGDKTCDRSEENKCFKMLSKDYKFYLAFENSNCKDYITEKFFRNGLMHDILPIAMGAHPADYRRAAPPNSYLHVENFTSPEHLAKYLHKLDKNDDLYNAYFQWKGTGSFINTKFWCRLCALLNDPAQPKSTIQHLHNWWRPPGVCIRGDQLWTDY